jgi:hypothetical protein
MTNTAQGNPLLVNQRLIPSNIRGFINSIAALHTAWIYYKTSFFAASTPSLLCDNNKINDIKDK